MTEILLAALALSCFPEQNVVGVVQGVTGNACIKYKSFPATYFCADQGSTNSGYSVVFRTGPHPLNTATADVARCSSGQCGTNWFAVQCGCSQCDFVTPR